MSEMTLFEDSHIQEHCELPGLEEFLKKAPGNISYTTSQRTFTLVNDSVSVVFYPHKGGIHGYNLNIKTPMAVLLKGHYHEKAEHKSICELVRVFILKGKVRVPSMQRPEKYDNCPGVPPGKMEWFEKADQVMDYVAQKYRFSRYIQKFFEK